MCCLVSRQMITQLELEWQYESLAPAGFILCPPHLYDKSKSYDIFYGQDDIVKPWNLYHVVI